MIHGFNFGATGAVPAMRWLQLGYFRVVQNETSLISGRTTTVAVFGDAQFAPYFGNVIFSDLKSNGVAARTISATLSRNLSSYGHLTLHDQLQLGSFIVTASSGSSRFQKGTCVWASIDGRTFRQRIGATFRWLDSHSRYRASNGDGDVFR